MSHHHVTPREAKDMWCPEVRRLYCDNDGSGAGINRRGGLAPENIAPCISFQCMFWRWTAPTEANPEPETGYCGKVGA